MFYHKVITMVHSCYSSWQSDLPIEQQLYISISADNTNIGGKTEDVEITQYDLTSPAKWAARNNVPKYRNVLDYANVLHWSPDAKNDPFSLDCIINNHILDNDLRYFLIKSINAYLRLDWLLQNEPRTQQRNGAIYSDNDQYLKAKNYSAYLQVRNRGDVSKNCWKADFETSITIDAKSSNKRLYAYARSHVKSCYELTTFKTKENASSRHPP